MEARYDKTCYIPVERMEPNGKGKRTRMTQQQVVGWLIAFYCITIKMLNFRKRIILVFHIMLATLLVISLRESCSRSEVLTRSLTQTLPTDPREELPHNNDLSCKERRDNVFLLRTPKCGSTTLQGIMYRYGLAHDLDIAIHKEAIQFDRVKYMERQQLIPSRNVNGSYNILASHLWYKFNKNFVSEILPPDTFYVTAVRHPLDHFLSWIMFFKEHRDRYLEEKKRQTWKSPADLIAESMETGTGILKDLFTNSISDYLAIPKTVDAEQMQTFLVELDDRFDFIIIVEYFDESLVLLKRYLCWSLKDIVYHKANTGKYGEEELGILLDHRVQKWVAKNESMDYQLYNYFLKRFWQRIAKQGVNFFSEVLQFQLINSKVSQFCTDTNGTSMHIDSSAWNEEFVVYRQDCSLMAFKNMYPQTVRFAQYQRDRVRKDT
ncbi:hypothetical protein ScPMuIL_001881 [Solemya velum]